MSAVAVSSGDDKKRKRTVDTYGMAPPISVLEPSFAKTLKEQLKPLREQNASEEKEYADLDEFIQLSGPVPKRTKSSSSSSSSSGIFPSKQPRESVNFIAPWAANRTYSYRGFMENLHEEILDFCAYVSPTTAEQRVRDELVERLQGIARTIWPHASLLCFGSFATKLYLPMSDIDLVLMHPIELGDDDDEDDDADDNDDDDDDGSDMDTSDDDDDRHNNGKKKLTLRERKQMRKDAKKKREAKNKRARGKAKKEANERRDARDSVANDLEALAEALRSADQVTYLEVIQTAKVPIVKFTDKSTGIQVDICVNISNGLYARDFVRDVQQIYPALRPLTLVLKYFLVCRDLAETYTGGCGSFLLQLMIISHLQRVALSTHALNQLNLGALLLSFFKLYGIVFDSEHLAISVRGKGHYFTKVSRDWYQPARPDLISVENPLDQSHDVGANSYRMGHIRRAFKYAYQALLADADGHHAPTLLSRVINIHPKLMESRPLTNAQINQSRERSASTAAVLRVKPRRRRTPTPVLPAPSSSSSSAAAAAATSPPPKPFILGLTTR